MPLKAWVNNMYYESRKYQIHFPNMFDTKMGHPRY